MLISETVQKAIQEQLPSLIAGELKEYIQKTSEWEKELIIYKQEIINQNNKLCEKDERIEKLDKILKSYKDLEIREKKALDLEIKLEIDILKIKLEESNKRADQIKQLAEIVFRNPRMVSTHSDDKRGYDNQRGSYHDNHTITTTQQVE